MLGILVPIAIHLWSRRKVVRVKVGSIKLLQESEPRQTNTLRPNELWLLLLRSLLLLLVALILAKPQFNSKTANRAILYLVEPSILTNEKMEDFLTSLPKDGIRLLAEGFPEFDPSNPINMDTVIPNYWQLAREMETLATDSVVVFAQGQLSGLQGKRPAIAGHIRWNVLNSEDSSNKTLAAFRQGDSLQLLQMRSNAEVLQFSKKSIPTANGMLDSIQTPSGKRPVTVAKPVKVLLVYVDSLRREKDLISAAFKSVATFLERPVQVTTATQVDSLKLGYYDVSVWLGVAPTAITEKVVLRYRPDAMASQLITSGIAPNEYFLTRGLNSENSVRQHLPQQLLSLLGLHIDLESAIALNDKRTVTVEELAPILSKEQKEVGKAQFLDITHWLWWLLLPLMVIERIIAKYRRQ